MCAAISTVTYTGEYHRPATGIGQVRALAVAVNSLSKAYSHQLDLDNILLSQDPLQERIEHDLLLLGGPKNNEVTAQFLQAMKDVQPALQLANPDRIIWREKVVKIRWVSAGAVEFTCQVSHKQVVLDYGLIMRVQNPFTSTRDTSVILSRISVYPTATSRNGIDRREVAGWSPVASLAIEDYNFTKGSLWLSPPECEEDRKMCGLERRPLQSTHLSVFLTIPTVIYAVLIEAAFCKPNSSVDCSRI